MSAPAVALLPPLIAFLCASTASICYLLATQNGHAPATLPFISDIAIGEPERTVFATASCPIFVLLLTIVELQYHHFRLANLADKELQGGHRLNQLAWYAGVAAAFGVAIVACVPVTQNQIMHLFGAVLCLLVATGYSTVVAYLSLIGRFKTPATLKAIRAALCATGILSIFIGLSLAFIRLAMNPRAWDHYGIPIQLPTDDRELIIYYCCATTEWIVAVAFLLNIITLSFELSTLKLDIGKAVELRS